MTAGCCTRIPGTTAGTHPLPERAQMFLFFSNRLGCAGSLLVSAAVTVVLLLIFMR